MALLRRARDARSDFFPGFTDVGEIGIGSLATVYRAREVGTNRLVALKLLNVRDASPRAIESFERESIALGAVSSHPNIVTLYRSFRAADGRPVLVLELCRGAVSDRTQGGQGLPVAEVVGIGVKIAGALETAHRAEILHRDVKPQNILITDFGEPALADFGVAMLQSSTQTTAGLFDFTTLHAAPELLEGGETSAATDVYELASSLYQLIAGRSAFRAYDGESPASVILRILRDPVQPLVNAHVPSQLSDLLIYAMNKDKESRPPTAAEFAAELSAVEAAQSWPRTQFLIREAGGAAVGMPSITRLPDWTERRVGAAQPLPTPGAPLQSLTEVPAPPPPPPVAPPVAPPPLAPPPVAPPPEPEPVPAPVVQLPAPAAPAPAPAPAPVPSEDWSVVSLVSSRAAAPEVEPPRPRPKPIEEPVVEEPVVEEPVVEEPVVEEPVVEEPVVEEPVAEEPVAEEPAPVQRIAVRIDEDDFEDASEELAAPPAAEPSVPAPAPEPYRPLPSRTPSHAGQQYPIPPAVSDEPPAPAAAVPTWSFRAPSPGPHPASTQSFVGDLSLDPLSLRRRATIRAGASALTVDDTRLALRTWWRRSEIPWSEVRGFEPRFDGTSDGGNARTGRLVALTNDGAVELNATKRPLAELRYLHALLDAYRQRAQLLANR